MILLPVIASNLEDFARTLSFVPSLFQTYVSSPDKSYVVTKKATCFPLMVRLLPEKDLRFFVVNYHALTLRDSLGNIIAEVDTGSVLRNAEDTVITIRVKVFRKNPAIDIALLENVGPIPSAFKIETTGILIDLNVQTDPLVGEKIFYSGFPLLLGEDTTLKQNYPLVINGSVSQVLSNKPDFIVQAPIFSGASGSPIMSQNDGRFLGVIFGSVPKQESLLYALKANIIRIWITKILLETIRQTVPQKK